MTISDDELQMRAGELLNFLEDRGYAPDEAIATMAVAVAGMARGEDHLDEFSRMVREAYARMGRG